MAENVIAAGAKNQPPMLEKGKYDSWKTHIWLYIQGKENGEMLIGSIKNGPYKLKAEITIPGVDGVADQKHAQIVAVLSPAEKLRYDCDIKATNIILLGFPVEIYTLSTTLKLLRRYGI
ncbi:hypothetical protein Tco_0466279 [Tanacetum coccineum]